MDPLFHLAHQRMTDLHDTADAIRRAREAATAATSHGPTAPRLEPEPTLAALTTDACEPCGAVDVRAA